MMPIEAASPSVNAECHRAEHRDEYAELRTAAEEERSRIRDERTEVCHGSDAEEDDGREQFKVNALAYVVIQPGGRCEHSLDAPAAFVKSA